MSSWRSMLSSSRICPARSPPSTGWKPAHPRPAVALAAGTLPLTHEGLDAWPRPRAVHYLCDLLVSCGVLAPADNQLRGYHAWLDHRVDSLAGHPHLRLLRQFGLLHQLPRMRARAAAGPLRATARQYARNRFIQAETFLTWPADAGVQPSVLTQADIDSYYASHLALQRHAVRAFLIWAREHGHIPGHLDIPRQAPSAGQVITQQRRLGNHPATALDDGTLPGGGAVLAAARGAASRAEQRPAPAAAATLA